MRAVLVAVGLLGCAGHPAATKAFCSDEAYRATMASCVALEASADTLERLEAVRAACHAMVDAQAAACDGRPVEVEVECVSR